MLNYEEMKENDQARMTNDEGNPNDETG